MSATLGFRTDGGFTMIELLVAIMIIAILFAFSIPQYYKSLERDKASEAFHLFLNLKGSQDRYYAKYGGFCTSAACSLDFAPPALYYFQPSGAYAPGGTGDSRSWTLSLVRNTPAPALYGQYTLTYDVEPSAAPVLTCSQSNCYADLMPNPN